MTATLTIRDETASGAICHERPLEFPTERITVRALIRERVYQEVSDYNQSGQALVFRGLVQPTDTERTLNGSKYRLKAHRSIAWNPQFERAVEAFDRNGFFILIDDRQAESLDEEFTIGHDTTVSFVKLTMLVGG